MNENESETKVSNAIPISGVELMTDAQRNLLISNAITDAAGLIGTVLHGEDKLNLFELADFYDMTPLQVGVALAPLEALGLFEPSPSFYFYENEESRAHEETQRVQSLLDSANEEIERLQGVIGYKNQAIQALEGRVASLEQQVSVNQFIRPTIRESIASKNPGP